MDDDNNIGQENKKKDKIETSFSQAKISQNEYYQQQQQKQQKVLWNNNNNIILHSCTMYQKIQITFFLSNKTKQFWSFRNIGFNYINVRVCVYIHCHLKINGW